MLLYFVLLLLLFFLFAFAFVENCETFVGREKRLKQGAIRNSCSSRTRSKNLLAGTIKFVLWKLVVLCEHL